MKTPSQRRSPHGKIFNNVSVPGKAPTKIQPRTDLTHCFYTEGGDRSSLQGMRCKLLRVLTNGRCRVEFEKGEIVVVRMSSLKRLPS